MKKLTIKTKMTVWYVIMILTLLGIFVPYLYISMSNKLYNNEESQIRVHIAQALSLVDIENNIAVFDQPNALTTSGTYIYIYDSQNRLVKGINKNSEIIQPSPVFDRPRIIYSNENKWLIFDQPLYNDNKVIAWIRASRSLEPIQDALRNLIIISLFAVPIYLLIAVAGGVFIAGKALSPIDKITRTARQIGQGNLTQRLDLPSVEDEVGRLALTFDEMLDRLEAAFKRERQFTADVSHELRTPLTIISTHAEEALNGKKSIQEYKRAIDVILKECRMMSQVISQLLLLTRSDEGKYNLEIEKLSLNIIVRNVVEVMRNQAVLSGIELILIEDESLSILINQTLITRMLINLIDNAIKYNKNGGMVKVILTKSNNYARITIEDNGIGISADELPFIFQRFYRVDKARVRTGTGLGLAIVKWIVDVHNGQINVESILNKETKFEVDLPLSKMSK